MALADYLNDGGGIWDDPGTGSRIGTEKPYPWLQPQQTTQAPAAPPAGGTTGAGAGAGSPTGGITFPTYDITPYGGITSPAPTLDIPAFNPGEFEADPGYQFRLDQGLDAANRTAAARGTLSTGGQIRSLADYASGLASQEYGNWFNREVQQYLNDIQRRSANYASQYAPWELQQNLGFNGWNAYNNQLLQQLGLLNQAVSGAYGG